MKLANAVAVQDLTTFTEAIGKRKRSLTTLKLSIWVTMVVTMTLSAAAQRKTEVITSAYQNPQQLALKAWYPANQSAVVTLHPGVHPLSTPGSLVFDGSNIFVEHVAAGGNKLDKLQASDNKFIATYTVGDAANPQAFDGVNIIAPDHNPSAATVYFVRAADGNVASCNLGAGVTYANNAAFDGQYVWVSTNSGYIVKLLFNNTTRSCSPPVCTYGPAGSRLYDLASDGNGNMWVTAVDTSQVIELNSACGMVTSVGAPGPISIVFDGTYFWTANQAGNSVSQVDPSTATVVSTTPLSYSPWWIAYDGANIWTTGPSAGMVSKMSANNPIATLTNYQACGSASSFPLQLAFDGANMWVGCEGINQLGKM